MLQAHLSRLIALGTVVASVALWSVVATWLIQARNAHVEHILRRNFDFAQIFAEHVDRLFDVVDTALQRAAPLISGADPLDETLDRTVRETGLSDGLLVQLSLADSQGRFIGSNLSVPTNGEGRVDLSDRAHVRVHLDGRIEGLYVGAAVLGRVSGRETIQLSRAIRTSRGCLLGVAVASVDPEYLTALFRRVDAGHGAETLLFGLADGVVRAGIVDVETAKVRGESLSGSAVYNAVVAAPSGRFVAAAASGIGKELIAYTRVGAFPLAVSVSSQADEELRQLAKGERGILAAAAVGNLLILAGGMGLSASARRLQTTLAALRQSRHEALESLKARNDFLTAVSHEFRTPLTAIRGFAELMSQRACGSDERRAAQAIEVEAARLSSLLERILAFAGDSERRARTAAAPGADLLALVEERVNAFYPRAVARGLQLRIVAAEIPLPGLRTGTEVLREALDALLSNAIKFTEHGGVDVRLYLAGPDEAAIEVSDTGPGIDPRLRGRLFEAFQQGDDVSRVHGGIGLGLAEARRLAVGAGGELELVRSDATGSCFRLTLPAGKRGPMDGFYDGL